MQEIIYKLLTESGYVKLNPLSDEKADLYSNNSKSDHIILAEYKPDEIVGFEAVDKTKEIVSLYKEQGNDKNLLKNTSLVISLKVNNPNDHDILKNSILKVEENPFAFRKYVAVYNDNAISGIDLTKPVMPQIEAIVGDDDRFKAFEAGNGDDEYKFAIELFVKLPFMKVRNMQSVSIEEFISPLNSDENV
ncbi:MAG: ABC-three component system middle component 1, partial [Candidatus Saccharimonadaceae bacterium]